MIRPLLLLFLLTFIAKSSTKLTSSPKTKVTTKPEPPAPKTAVKPKPDPDAPKTDVKSKPETPAPAPPTKTVGNDHDLPHDDHVQEENPRAEQTKNKPVAKPGRSLKITSKVTQVKDEDRPIPTHKKKSLTQTDIKSRGKVKKNSRYQIVAPPKGTVTKSPVNRAKYLHIGRNKHGHRHTHGHKNGHRHKNGHNNGHGHKHGNKRKQIQSKMYKKHVGKTERKHRRKGMLLSKDEYLRRLEQRRQQRREYLKRFNERRQRRLKYLGRLRQKQLERRRQQKQKQLARQVNTEKTHPKTKTSEKTHSKTKTSAVAPVQKHHHDKATKTRQLKTYLKKKTDAEKQKHDAERKVVQAYLLFRLYEMVRGYLNTEHSCQKHFVEVKVGTDSPAFGGALVDSPRVFLSDFSITGFDETMSRLELYGCKHLPQKGTLTDKTDPTAPCGPGPYTLLWAWYNGQSPVKLPGDIAVLAGFETDVHFLVARLVKFSMIKTNRPIVLKHKIVKIHFTDCRKPKRYRHSNYRFVRTMARPRPTLHQRLHVDISCKNEKSSFIVYGFVGEMGMHGKHITVWADNHKVTMIPTATINNTINQTATTNTTKIELGSLRVSYKIHLLPTPIRIGPGEILKARCEYHDRGRYSANVNIPYRSPREELCKITLMTMVQHSSTIGPETCSTPADFGTESVTLRFPELGIVEFLQANPFAVMAGFGVLLVVGLLVVRCRSRAVGESEQGRRAGMNTHEFQGLLRDYDEFESNLKMK